MRRRTILKWDAYSEINVGRKDYRYIMQTFTPIQAVHTVGNYARGSVRRGVADDRDSLMLTRFSSKEKPVSPQRQIQHLIVMFGRGEGGITARFSTGTAKG